MGTIKEIYGGQKEKANIDKVPEQENRQKGREGKFKDIMAIILEI